jgi:hypothetical protein
MKVLNFKLISRSLKLRFVELFSTVLLFIFYWCEDMLPILILFEASARLLLNNSIPHSQHLLFDFHPSEVRRLLAVLAPRILDISGKLDMIAVGQALFGMQRMSSDCSEVRAVISALATQVRQCNEQFDPQAVSNTVLGMREMSSSHEVVCTLLSVLTPKIRECSDKMSAKELSNAMCGLRRMRSEHSEVRSLLLALTPKVRECLEPPNEAMLGNLLTGLQGMSTDHVEVLEIISGLQQHALRCVHQLSSDSLSKAVHGLQRADSTHLEVREIVQELAGKMNKSQDVFMAENIGTALYGMQRMSADHAEVRSLLSALHSKIVKCRAHPDSIDVKERKYITFSKKDLPHMRSNDIANALYGLQNMDSDHAEVRKILFVLTPLLKNCVDQFSTSALTNALYGMKRMRSDHSEVRTILSCLTPRLSVWKNPTAEDLGLGLKGLGSMSCSHSEVREMAEAFVPNVERCQEIFSSKSIADAMSGLRCMSSDTAVVRDLLLVLVPQIQRCTDIFSAEDICRTLSSLRGMSSEYSEVLTLLLVTVLKVKNCEEDFSAGMVSDVLYGLQGMSNEHFEVRTLLFAIIPRVKNCKGVFTAGDIGKALWGLQGLMGKVESQSLLEYFSGRVQLLDFQSLDTVDIISLSRYLTLIILLLEFKVNHKEQHSKWTNVNNVLLQELKRRRTTEKGMEVTTDTLNAHALIISDADGDSGLISRCMSVFKGSSVRIFCRRDLLVLFESDITLQVMVPDTGGAILSDEKIEGKESTNDTSDYFIINIEVDSGKYDEMKGLRYYQQRDRYLKSKGIFTVRVRSVDLKSTGPSILDSWLLRMVSTFSERYKELREQVLYDERIYDNIG